ncbi:MAG TPA: proprotein convertase P-domain-containing protein, partial [Isosphaeraceae bacterium]
EVRDVLKRSCDRIDPQGGRYDAAGRSPLYGFGRLNALTAVQLALPPRPTDAVLHAGNFNAPIRDFQTAQVGLAVGESTAIAAIKVLVEIDHTFIGDLVVTVLPPANLGLGGIVLHDRAGGGTRNLRRTFDATSTPALAGLQGRNPKGTWTLQVRDTARADEGAILRFGVELTFAPSRAAPAPAGDGPRRRPRSRSPKDAAHDAPSEAGPTRAGRRSRRGVPKSD